MVGAASQRRVVDELVADSDAARLTARVAAVVLQRLQALYKPAAVTNYRLAAQSLRHSGAGLLSNCADIIDVESDGGSLVPCQPEPA